MSMAEQMATVYGVPDCPCCGAAPRAGFRNDDFRRDQISIACTVCSMLGVLEDWRRRPQLQQDAHVQTFYRCLAKLHELIDGYIGHG